MLALSVSASHYITVAALVENVQDIYRLVSGLGSANRLRCVLNSHGFAPVFTYTVLVNVAIVTVEV